MKPEGYIFLERQDQSWLLRWILIVVRLQLANSAAVDLEVLQFDIKTSFLHGIVDEDGVM